MPRVDWLINLSERDFFPEECVLWPYAKTAKGYGSVCYEGFQWRAHRLIWLLVYDQDPADSLVRHKCRNTSCCNPNHLELGTGKQNAADRLRDGTEIQGEQCHFSKLTEAEVREIYRRASQGLPMAEILEGFDHDRRIVKYICTGHTWKHLNLPTLNRRFTDGPLQESDVREIHLLRQSGLTYKQLGERFGVSARVCNMICKGQRWAHLGLEKL